MRIQLAVSRGAAAVLLLLAAACKGIFDVDNPNSVRDDDLNNPSASTPLANGTGASVTRALSAIYSPYGAASDELQWIGSRDGFKSLDDGFVSDPANEFTDAAMPEVHEARYMADNTIRRLSGMLTPQLDATNTARVRTDLARTYLYGAVIYTTIADMADDFVIGEPGVTNAPIGEANMSRMYDTAIVYLDRGLTLAGLVSNAGLQRDLTGMRARAKFSKAIWQKINPPSATAPAQPLVSDAGAAADAQAALALMAADYRLQFTPLQQTLGFPIVGNDINTRLELRPGDTYVVPNSAGTRYASIRLVDPVTNQPDVALKAIMDACCIQAVGDLLPHTIISAREMRLIIAEDALARGNTAEFTTQINAIRALNSLPAYNGTSPEPVVMLRHMRQVHLYMQGRRLQDMYRFGIRDAKWTPSSHAGRRFGCFFPITVTERLANPNVTTPPSCQG
jgi:starch-binding outer membrane protein, SusD/RagB family